MLTHEEYELLSSDPAIALAEAIEIVLQRVEERAGDRYYSDGEPSQRYIDAWNDAASVLSGIADALDTDHDIPFEDHGNPWGAWQDRFRRALQKHCARANMRRAREKAAGVSRMLDFSAFSVKQTFRDEIRGYTRKIRGILNQVDLGPNLRQLLISRLNAHSNSISTAKELAGNPSSHSGESLQRPREMAQRASNRP